MSTNCKKEKIFFLLILALILFSQISYSQKKDKLHKILTSKDSAAILRNRENIFAQNNFSIQIKACALPKADINTSEGTYHLLSRLQSSYSIGVNYQTNPGYSLGMSSGLHFNLTNRNFFLHIPDSDLPGFLSTNGAPQIEDKEVYLRLVIPFRITYRFLWDKKGFWNLSGGVNINYSGFSSDEGIGTSIGDANFQFTSIFESNFKSNNDGKPWLTLLLSPSRTFYLKNNNLLAIELFVELSKTSYVNGNYEIIIPNKPITRGTYSVTGSCVGLSVEYTFTRAGRVDKELKKKRYKPFTSIY